MLSMKRFILGLVAYLFFATPSFSQIDGIFYDGEAGISFGGAHYFGDLNTKDALNRPGIAIGAFYKKQFDGYVGVKVAGHFAQVSYADKYNTNNAFAYNRNLSFNSNIYEFTFQGDFNFFKYYPSDPRYIFTPYLTFGIGLFGYSPYAYESPNNNTKYYLRQLGTEGQGWQAVDPPGKVNFQPYKPIAFCFPLGVGVKYSLSPSINVFAEAVYRLTDTDFLDDVSTTYVAQTSILDPVAKKFQNRALGLLMVDPLTGLPLRDSNGNLINSSYGQPGSQRGFSNQMDKYFIAEIGISLSIKGYRCPH